jgi:predicted transcriptional regulator
MSEPEVKRSADAKAYEAICQSGEDGISYNDLKVLRVNRAVQRLMLLGMVRRRKVARNKYVYVANKSAVDFKLKPRA